MNIISGVQKQIFGLINDEVEWFRMLCSKNVHNLHKLQTIIRTGMYEVLKGWACAAMRETVCEGEFLCSNYLENNNLEDQERNGREVLIMGDVRSGEGQGRDEK